MAVGPVVQRAAYHWCVGRGVVAGKADQRSPLARRIRRGSAARTCGSAGDEGDEARGKERERGGATLIADQLRQRGSRGAARERKLCCGGDSPGAGGETGVELVQLLANCSTSSCKRRQPTLHLNCGRRPRPRTHRSGRPGQGLGPAETWLRWACTVRHERGIQDIMFPVGTAAISAHAVDAVGILSPYTVHARSSTGWKAGRLGLGLGLSATPQSPSGGQQAAGVRHRQRIGPADGCPLLCSTDRPHPPTATWPAHTKPTRAECDILDNSRWCTLHAISKHSNCDLSVVRTVRSPWSRPWVHPWMAINQASDYDACGSMT
ncbi:hypothetical protein T440DRAFT_217537 [Plenodomus tracheiphilus IPT5]|uniref:Uncharacterized protein n=1 Tax=Plenodomus tracheiphilus IPT5 TaxID=1408161 RepID=A0A6A7AVR2_9PLEO|nr:hypothetical protein T440DRAFT_217537 [Plenodomus tracheiphilus IPT5]